MADLTDVDPQAIAAYLRGNGLLSSPIADARPAGFGLLSPVVWRGPAENEDWSTRLFGNPRDPSDPRGSAMMALGLGLMRRDFAGGMEAANRAFSETEERSAKRALAALQMGKGSLELSELQRKLQDDAEGRQILQDFYRKRQAGGGQGQAPQGALPFNPSSLSLPAFNGEPSPGQMGPMPETQQFPQLPGPGSSAFSPTTQAGQVGMPGGAGSSGFGAPQSAAQFPSRSSAFEQYRQLGDAFAAKGQGAKAQSYYELAEKYRPKYNTTPQVVRGAGGQLINVLIGEDGTVQPMQYGVKPSIKIQDLGGTVTAIDENQAQNGQSWNKTMTPGEVASNRIAQGNLAVARGTLGVSERRLALDENSPTYVQTESGLVALPKRPAPGAPLIGQPVQSPDGTNLGPPLKQIPPSANTAIVTNLQNLSRAKTALALLKGEEVNGAKGDPNATGWKAYLPGDVLNRWDEDGIQTRAAISDLGSMVIHERSGAAVTASESPRLKPFIPLATDSRETAQKKLERFVEIYQQETNALSEIYSKEQGYRPNPALTRNSTSGNADARAEPTQGMDTLPKPNANNKGKYMRDNETGKLLRSNGMAWVEVK